MACRVLVRAHVLATQSKQTQDDNRAAAAGTRSSTVGCHRRLERHRKINTSCCDCRAPRLASSQLFEEARTVLGHGHSVIADAVFDRAADRQKIKQCAVDAAVPFTALWLEAPMSLLFERIAKRRGDPSDATVDIVRAQAARQHGIIDWIKVPVSDDLDDVVARVLNILDTDVAAPANTAVPDRAN
jgi:predicted kinase